MFCENCGNENRSGSRFCRFCGTEIVVLIDATFSPVQAPVEAPQQAAQEEQTTAAGEPAVEVPQTSAVESSSEVAPAAAGAPDVEFPTAFESPFEPLSVEAESVAVQPEETPEYIAEAAVPQADDWGSEPVDLAMQSELIDINEPAPARAMDGANVEQASEMPIDDRYWILASYSLADESTAYQAEDRRRCITCGTVQIDLLPHYCEMCGAELSTWPVVELIPVMESVEGAQVLTIGGQLYQVMEQPSSSVQPAQVKSAFRLDCGWLADVGAQREINEDSVLVLEINGVCQDQPAPQAGFYAVADGIGGHEAGEVASRAAVQALGAGAMQSLLAPLLQGDRLGTEETHERMKTVVYGANLRVLGLRHQGGADSNMGSTVTAVLVMDQQVVVTNAGDSRTYLLRDAVLRQVTKDHSLVAEMVESGKISAEEAQYHPQKNVITRCLGDRADLVLDLFDLELAEGDRLLLCSDGLWEMVPDPVIEDTLLAHPNAQDACKQLVQLANQAGGEDNISVIVVGLKSL